ncbi:hypothetical protein [Pseudogemmobacter bohemicus]|uniref:hypothetical protein n=1 Tax=Pseudogemmobacter bohemicus TaxID=2250708 RepID=UPI000DD3410E|nr:hypothetical protein [Pseudogemmobacter bohemicus]
MYRLFAALAMVLTLSSCAESIWAPDDQVARATFVAGAPTEITLFTTINDRNGSGAHSALLINGSQRILFDPAGTWQHDAAPERNDVHFGMTDRMVNFYLDYHARDSESEKFHVIERKLLVSPAVAEEILQRALSNGAVPKAHCARSIAGILRPVPGFEGLTSSYFPKRLDASFAGLPGVTTRIVTEENDNPGAGHGVVLVDKKGQRVN